MKIWVIDNIVYIEIFKDGLNIKIAIDKEWLEEQLNGN